MLGESRCTPPHSFNQLDLPEYEDYNQLLAALKLAINEGAVGFGFA